MWTSGIIRRAKEFIEQNIFQVFAIRNTVIFRIKICFSFFIEKRKPLDSFSNAMILINSLRPVVLFCYEQYLREY